MKDFNLKQSIMIVAGGCGLALVGIYFYTSFLSASARGKAATTRNEEGQLANAIAQYAVVFQKYPSDNNVALTKNLTGDNPQQLTLLTLAESSTNKDGQLVDIWNTPYKFTFNSTNSFSIASAGENKAFGDTDDVVFDSVSNALPKP